MKLEVTLAISAQTPTEALSTAAGLNGFEPDKTGQPELIQEGIYGVAGLLSKPVEHRLVVGFVRSKLRKLDPMLRSIVAQHEARLQLCPSCSNLPSFGGCLRKNCEAADCKATRFSSGIDRSLRLCYACCEQSGRCQRCGNVFKAAQQQPNEQPVKQPAIELPGRPSLPEPRRRSYYVTYLRQADPNELPLKRGSDRKLRLQRIAEQKRQTEDCAADLRKRYPKLRVTVIGPLIVNVYGKSIRALSDLPNSCGAFIRGEVLREPEPLLPNPVSTSHR